MEPGNVRDVNIESEVRGSFVDYAMSVIVSRALPDARDGLKPVQRRIIFGMEEMGIRAGTAYRKCAKIVGDVMGKYHPHGDSAIYDALVRLAQPFSMRYPLVDGQGNFGSIDDDPPAAMRYTEARLTAIASELVEDIEKNTVDFIPNFDDSEQQPVVLPSKLPNLLLNGAVGIAVGMATNIPPHNLGELCDATGHLIDNPDCTIDDLMRFVKGPDFPTSGQILGTDGLRQAYSTGRGRMVLRAKAHIEENRGGRFQIVVTEIPYQVNKAALIAKIAELVKDKRLDGIAELRDESDRQGIRVVIEVAKTSNPRSLLNNLYKLTQLQIAFSINMLALVDNQPRILTLKTALQQFVEHRRIVITRRTEFDLEKARARAHILEGLKIALDNLDAVIATIRNSASAEAARGALQTQFGLSDLQAQAILDMQLRRLAALESQRILDELAEVLKLIAELEDLLANPQKIFGVIKADMKDLKKTYGDERRTAVLADVSGDFSVEDLIPQEKVVVTISRRGYIKRVPIDTYRTQSRGGRGKMGMVTRDEDGVLHLYVANTHDSVLFFTNRGKVFHLKAHEIPEQTRTARGVPLINMVGIDVDEQATGLIVVRNFEVAENLLFVTRKGEVKRVRLADFANVRSTGIKAMDLDASDELVWVKLAGEKDDAILISSDGKAVRFALEDVRLSNRGSGGMRGMKLLGADTLVGAEIVDKAFALSLVTTHGIGKRTPLSGFVAKGRGTQGVKALAVDARTGKLAAACLSKQGDDIMIVTTGGVVIRQPAETRLLSRVARGYTMIKLDATDQVVSMARVETVEEAEAAAK